jgi:hypothetical protein
MTRQSSPRVPVDLEQQLRAGASHFGPRSSPLLQERIRQELRATPQVPDLERLAPRAERGGAWLAAAAAAFVLGSAWWLTQRTETRVERGTSIVALSQDLFGASARVLALPKEAEASLRLEARNLLADSTRVASGIVRGLPGPLRDRLEQL